MSKKEIIDLRTDIKETEPPKDFKFHKDTKINFLDNDVISFNVIIFDLKFKLSSKNYKKLLEKTKGDLIVDSISFRKKEDNVFLLELSNSDKIILVSCTM